MILMKVVPKHKLMDGYNRVFCRIYVLLTIMMPIKGSNITVTKHSCGGDMKLNERESIFLNYYGANLGEGFYFSSKECTFKISVSQKTNDICIRQKDRRRSSFFKLEKCNDVFEYYIDPVNSYSCINFHVNPLCIDRNTVLAVFKNPSIFVSNKGIAVELEIYARKPYVVQDNQQYTTSSSWKDSDHKESTPVWILGIILFIVIVVCVLLWTYCSCNKIKEPCITANTQERVGTNLPDNPFINEQDDCRRPCHIDPSKGQSESPPTYSWEPPPYQSVVLIDQSYYGEARRHDPTRVNSNDQSGNPSERSDEGPLNSLPYKSVTCQDQLNNQTDSCQKGKGRGEDIDYTDPPPAYPGD